MAMLEWQWPGDDIRGEPMGALLVEPQVGAPLMPSSTGKVATGAARATYRRGHVS